MTLEEAYDLHAFDRLFDRTIISATNCFEFTGSLNECGYGQIGYKRRLVTAHRLAYMLCVNDIPKDMQVLHRCDNPKCVNPEHLFLGTHKDNMRDRHEKGRANYIRFRGEARSDAKLNDAQVREIRELWETGTSQHLLASVYGISQSVISKIVNKKAWAHVE